jgi:hypothetical protein
VQFAGLHGGLIHCGYERHAGAECGSRQCQCGGLVRQGKQCVHLTFIQLLAARAPSHSLLLLECTRVLQMCLVVSGLGPSFSFGFFIPRSFMKLSGFSFCLSIYLSSTCYDQTVGSVTRALYSNTRRRGPAT